MDLTKGFLEEYDKNMAISNETKEALVHKFPYHQLVDVSNFDAEVLRALLKLLANIVRAKCFYDLQCNVDMTIQFYANRLRAAEAEDILNPARKFEQIIFQMIYLFDNAARFGKQYTINADLMITIRELVAKADDTDFIKLVYQLFGIIMQRHFVPSDEEFRSTIAVIWSANAPKETRIKLTNTLLSHPLMKENPVIDQVLLFFVDHLPILESNNKSLNDLLSACLRIFNDFEGSDILKKLAIKLIEKNSIDTLKMHLNESCASKILKHQIEIIFAAIPWNHDETEANSLSDAIEKFISNETSSITLELHLVITYLEIVHKDNYNQSDVEKMVQNFKNIIPTQLPAKKSLLLLFALAQNQNQDEIRAYQETLLRDLQFSDQFDHLITYHKAQLIWILDYGLMTLKLRTLNLWLKHDNNAMIQSLIQEKNVLYLLGKLIIYPEFDDIAVHERIFTLLKAMPDQTVIRHMIMVQMTKRHLTKEKIVKLLDAKPSIPKINAVNKQRQNSNRLAALFLITRFVYLLSNENQESDKTKMQSYLCQLLQETCIDRSVFINVVTTTPLLEFLAFNFNKGNENDQIYAVRMFYIVLYAQRKFKVDVDKCEIINPRLDLRNTWMCSFLEVFMRMRKEKITCAVRFAKELDLYYVLLQSLLQRSVGLIALKYIKQLFKDDPKVACAMINISTIEQCCADEIESFLFVGYLTEWVAMVQAKYPFMNSHVPWNSLSRYVTYLDEQQYCNVDYKRLRDFVNANIQQAE